MVDNEDIPISEFIKLFSKYSSSDWSPSPATNYIQCDPKNFASVDSSLASENERRLALCLPPFSKAFYIATGYSKLQVSEEYAELKRVIVWQNRQRRKKGLPFLSPAEFELFLQEEMSQDFSDLGIEIEDFLADLIKNHLEEEKSFAIYNKFIELHTSKIAPIDLTSDLDHKMSPQKTISTSVENIKPSATTTETAQKKSLVAKNIQLSHQKIYWISS
jgi:hypothetical protein